MSEIRIHEQPKGYVMVPQSRLDSISRHLRLIADAVQNVRSGSQAADLIKDLNIDIQVLATVAYNLQKKSIQAMQFGYDPTETGLRVIAKKAA